jgi:hypothetical protein
MINKLSKTIMLALAVVLVAAPLVLAQQSDRPGSSSSGTAPGTTSERPSTSPGTQSPSMGTTGAQDAIPATVAEVNQQKHTVKLHMQSGETVELKVPEQSLASLSKGDSVQVSIHKAAGQSNMPSSQQPSGTTGSTGTRSR